MADLLREFFHYHSWATLTLVKYCEHQPIEILQEKVTGTDRSILHTLTHIAGTEEEYQGILTGEPTIGRIRAGEVLSLPDLQEHLNKLSLRWESLLNLAAQLDVTLPADGTRSAIPHGQILLLLQTIQHGIDHRTQICTALSVLGLEPPSIDGWSYWASAPRI